MYITMKILFDKRMHSVLLSLLGVLVLSSCVNEEFDFSKEIDTDLTILKNVSMPIGSVEKITISDLLTLDENDSVIKTDDNGDFIFAFSGSSISAQIDVPSITIAPDGGIHPDPEIVTINTGAAAGLNASLVTQNIVYSTLTGEVFSTAMPVSINSSVPSQIADVKSVGLNASCHLKINVDNGAAHLMKGFTVEFPSFLQIKQTGYTDSRFELVDAHKVILKEDIAVSKTSPLTFALAVDKLNVPAGAIKNGNIAIEDEVSISGDFYLSPSDFTVIPEDITLEIRTDITDMEVLTAEVKLAVDEKIKGDVLEIGDLPEFLTGGNICLDIYNPSLNFNVTNSTPFGFGVKAAVKAVNGDRSVKVGIGENPAINIPAGVESKYVISRRETPTSSGVTNITVPEIGDLISMMPKTISFDDIRVQSIGDEYVTIAAGENYEAAITYDVNAPLAFDKDLNIEYTQNIENLGFTIDDVNAENISISLGLVNTIPLDFTITAEALDAAGNVMKDVSLSIDKTIKAGTISAPVQSDITLSLVSKADTFGFEGLRLAIKAVCPSEDMYGVALNINNSLEIKDIVLTCPEGIIVNM